MRFRWAAIWVAAGLPVLFLLGGGVGCGQGAAFLSGAGSCGGHVAPQQSAYVLPFQSGSTFLMSQGNCTSFTHRGNARYAYDFLMPIGTPIVAARAGTVIGVEDRFEDNQGGTDANYILIRHADGTIAQYLHLTKNGVLVSVNDSVVRGQHIGTSGNTGQSTTPHLHFDVRRSEQDPSSVPVSFSNSQPLESFGLRTGVEYSAN